MVTSTIANAPSPPPAVPDLPSRYPALDGLRGLAILLVLVHQFSLLEPQGDVLSFVFSNISNVGWTGVQLFFALSGFLITGILLDTRHAQNYFSGFYARRTLRIFPLYFVVLAVAFLVVPAIVAVPPKLAADQPHQVWLWTYTSNWATVLGVGSKAFPHFWSLAVEEQFYLVWPLLIRSRGPAQCVRFCLGVAVVSLLLRAVLAWTGASSEGIYQNSFCRMDALALGGAAAAALRMPAWREQIIARRNRLMLWSIFLMFAGLVITRGYSTSNIGGETIGYTIVSLIFVLILMAAAGADVARVSGWVAVLRLRPLTALGKYSYAMYVFHKPLHDYVGKPLLLAMNPKPSQSLVMNVTYVVLGTIVTFALAFISWHVFEKYFLQLKRFFAPRE